MFRSYCKSTRSKQHILLVSFLITMKFLILAVCLSVIISLAFAEDKNDKNVNIDLSEALGNERLITAYSKCLVNKGPCTPEIKKLKEKLPEVLQTSCAKCSDKQKQVGKQLINELKSKHPKIWSDLVSYYDPQGKYKQSLEEFLKS